MNTKKARLKKKANSVFKSFKTTLDTRHACRVIASCVNHEQIHLCEAWTKKVFLGQEPHAVQMAYVDWILSRQQKRAASLLNNDRHNNQRLPNATKRQQHIDADYGESEV